MNPYRDEKRIHRQRIWPPAAAMFLLLCLFFWLNEILDIPWLLLGGTKTHANFAESLLETALILLAGLIVLSKLMRDIKKRERAEAALQRANRKILEQQKALIEEERLKVLLQVSGAAAHELGQPLTAILGNVELLGMHRDDPEKLSRYLFRIQEAGQRMSSILKKTLTIPHEDMRSLGSESKPMDLDLRASILSVEDSLKDYEAIHGILKAYPNIQLSRAGNIADALSKLKERRFDLIFLDYSLPDGNGLDFLARLQVEGMDTPVVVITAHGDEMIAAKMIQCGAYDYVSKRRLSGKALTRIIANTMEKARLMNEIKKAHEKMAEMSTRDELTGLYNRRYCMEGLEREVSRAKRYGNHLSLCIMDLDHFKRINDIHGHPAGDMVLRGVGRMLDNCMRQSDLVCRYGGEEFVAILPDTQPNEARIVCERFRRTVAGHIFRHGGSNFRITVSVGMASYCSDEYKSPAQFLEMADQALYDAKARGRDRVVEFEWPNTPTRLRMA
jgi:diguanylate cyclase (GGDEF)-like protein